MSSNADQSRGPLPSPRPLAPFEVRKIGHFALVSGTGLLLDIALFLGLLALHLPAFLANTLSSAAAVSFVYLASVRRVFHYRGRFLLGMFAAYALYQCAGILVGSWAVQALIGAGVMPAGAKVAILPVTFAANYLFMCWLTARDWSR